MAVMGQSALLVTLDAEGRKSPEVVIRTSVEDHVTASADAPAVEPEVEMPLDNWTAAWVAALAIVVGGLGWLVREVVGRKRSERMETYLRLQRKPGDKGQRSAEQVMAALSMTAGQVRDAASRSPAIKRLATITSFGVSEAAVFEYAPFGTQGRDAI